MNLMNFRIEKEPAPSADWRIYGDIYDDQNQLVGTFGEGGTSLNEWWARQDEVFQADYVRQFVGIMARQIANGTAE